ncbi:MAG: acyl-ACP--UDP-N-acetylglucosamine O-acyltransferase [Verrucomicrobiota bacterium]
MSDIHPTALIDPNAEVDDSVSIGPFCIVEAGARIGKGCILEAHSQICSSVTLGTENRVGRGTILGGPPQSIAFDRSLPSWVVVDQGNVFGEYITVHRSEREGGTTRIGKGNFFMAQSHVGHDCEVGNENIFANAVALAGHVQVEHRTFLSAGSLFHQFIRLGSLAMIHGNARISQDVPPYCLALDYNEVKTLNVVGLKRSGMNAEVRAEIKKAFHLMYRQGLAFPKALELADAQSWGPETQEFLDFFRKPSPKGICHFRRSRH